MDLRLARAFEGGHCVCDVVGSTELFGGVPIY